MLLLLILADDFTGALDTGVQFAACGIPTRVVVGEQVDLQPMMPLCWWWTPRHAICPLQRPTPSSQN